MTLNSDRYLTKNIVFIQRDRKKLHSKGVWFCFFSFWFLLLLLFCLISLPVVNAEAYVSCIHCINPLLISFFVCVSTLSVYQLTLTNRVLEIIYSREILISTKFREKIIIESQYKHTRFGTVVLVGWVASLNSASPAHAGTKFNCDSIRLHSKFTQIFTPQKLCINKQKNYNK